MLQACAAVLLWILLSISAAAADPVHQFYACGATSKGYVVGARLPPSGLFLEARGGWEQRGFNHPYVVTLDYDPRDPRILYLATGQGCIRSADSGHSWRIVTGWDMTEVQDVSVDPFVPDRIFLALPDGIALSPDQGRTWSRLRTGQTRNYFQTIRADAAIPNRIFAGGEAGILLSEDGGGHWQLIAARQSGVTHIEQSRPHPAHWLATTQHQGLLLSTDDGRHWNVTLQNQGALYNAAFHPSRDGHILVCGWNIGVRLSTNGGKTWLDRSAGLPSRHVQRAGFHPDYPHRVYAAVYEEALYRSTDDGLTWTPNGLAGSVINDLVFVPQP